jgi:AAA domain
VATCDRLLGDLDRGREQLDARTVLVVDEAGMLGSRKLGRLLEYATMRRPRWCWSAMTGSWPRSTPAVGSAPSGCASGPAS